ncbi:MAG: hypothetical protein K0S93_2189 [Nitrososphaeraceae archaeon]|jgi:hypothetical protein|nr:hypothetical protein [Nitrososphaeraceae archaeon]
MGGHEASVDKKMVILSIKYGNEIIELILNERINRNIQFSHFM